MKLSTLVLLFLLAFFQVSAKPSREFADEEFESEEFAEELDTLQEELSLEDLESILEELDLEDLEFEEGDLEDFLADETEQNNPSKVLNQRTSIIKKILQLQQKLQSLVITPGFQGFGSSGSSSLNPQLLQLLLGGGQGGLSFGGSSFGGGNNNQLLQLLYGGGFGGSSFGGGNSKQLTQLWKQLQGGSSSQFNFGSNPSLLQNPQLIYYLLSLFGGKQTKSFRLPKAPKAPKTIKSTGPQMCWCPCQQANAPTQKYNPQQQLWGGSSVSNLGWGGASLGNNWNTWGAQQQPFFGFEEQEAQDFESEETVIPHA